MDINWNYISNFAVLEKEQRYNIEASIIKGRFRWGGHVLRMNRDTHQLQILYSVTSTGQRPPTSICIAIKDNMEPTMKKNTFSQKNWKDLTASF